jgi:hypothetical protein
MNAVATPSFSRIPGRDANDPWFRFGTMDVTTSTLLAGLAFVSMVIYAVSPDAFLWLVLWPEKIFKGQIWRMATWSFAERPGIFTALSLLFFWYFGNQVEVLFGARRFLIFLAVPVLTAAFVGLLIDVFLFAGLMMLSVIVLITFASEFPGAQFFFGIPARFFVAFLIAVQALQFIGDRGWKGLVFLAAVVVATLFALRSAGLGDDLKMLPAIPIPGLRSGASKVKAKKARGKGKLKAVPNPPSSGGWAPPGSAQSPEVQADVDRLLDKIASQGLGSLSKEERKRLDAASKQLRKDQ